VAARKPEDWVPADLSRLSLYSVAARRPILELGRTRKLVFPVVHKAHVAYRAILPERVRLLVERRQRSSG
jgi:hypothetical protein